MFYGKCRVTISYSEYLINLRCPLIQIKKWPRDSHNEWRSTLEKSTPVRYRLWQRNGWQTRNISIHMEHARNVGEYRIGIRRLSVAGFVGLSKFCID